MSKLSSVSCTRATPQLDSQKNPCFCWIDEDTGRVGARLQYNPSGALATIATPITTSVTTTSASTTATLVASNGLVSYPPLNAYITANAYIPNYSKVNSITWVYTVLGYYTSGTLKISGVTVTVSANSDATAVATAIAGATVSGYTLSSSGNSVYVTYTVQSNQPVSTFFTVPSGVSISHNLGAGKFGFMIPSGSVGAGTTSTVFIPSSTSYSYISVPNTTTSYKTGFSDIPLGITEVGLFDSNDTLVAYGTFPPVYYDPSKYHMSFNLLIQG